MRLVWTKVVKNNDSQPKVTHTCLEGYFRGNKSLPHELPPAILRAHHPRGSQLCPAQGPIARRDRREPRGGAAPPQPALPGAEPARQSRGRRQPPSCWEGEGRSPEGRVPKRVGLSAAARDRGKGGDLRRATARPRLGTCQTRAPPADSEVGPAPPGASQRRKAEHQRSGLRRIEMQILPPQSAAFGMTAWEQQDRRKCLQGQN